MHAILSLMLPSGGAGAARRRNAMTLEIMTALQRRLGDDVDVVATQVLHGCVPPRTPPRPAPLPPAALARAPAGGGPAAGPWGQGAPLSSLESDDGDTDPEPDQGGGAEAGVSGALDVPYLLPVVLQQAPCQQQQQGGAAAAAATAEAACTWLVLPRALRRRLAAAQAPGSYLRAVVTPDGPCLEHVDVRCEGGALPGKLALSVPAAMLGGPQLLVTVLLGEAPAAGGSGGGGHAQEHVLVQLPLPVLPGACCGELRALFARMCAATPGGPPAAALHQFGPLARDVVAVLQQTRALTPAALHGRGVAALAHSVAGFLERAGLPRTLGLVTEACEAAGIGAALLQQPEAALWAASAAGMLGAGVGGGAGGELGGLPLGQEEGVGGGASPRAAARSIFGVGATSGRSSVDVSCSIQAPGGSCSHADSPALGKHEVGGRHHKPDGADAGAAAAEEAAAAQLLVPRQLRMWHVLRGFPDPHTGAWAAPAGPPQLRLSQPAQIMHPPSSPPPRPHQPSRAAACRCGPRPPSTLPSPDLPLPSAPPPLPAERAYLRYKARQLVAWDLVAMVVKVGPGPWGRWAAACTHAPAQAPGAAGLLLARTHAPAQAPAQAFAPALCLEASARPGPRSQRCLHARRGHGHVLGAGASVAAALPPNRRSP